MALTRKDKIVGIEVLENDSIKVSTKVIVMENGKIIAVRNDYYVLTKMDENENPTDVRSESARVRAICKIVW